MAHKAQEMVAAELVALAALVFHDAVTMQAYNADREVRGLAMAYGEGNILDTNSQRLQRLLDYEAARAT